MSVIHKNSVLLTQRCVRSATPYRNRCPWQTGHSVVKGTQSREWGTAFARASPVYWYGVAN